jgi:hypothetical protein
MGRALCPAEYWLACGRCFALIFKVIKYDYLENLGHSKSILRIYKKQLEIAKISLQSVSLQREYAHYHYYEAKK